ncbi:hypothetical protein GCM10010421_06880 [Streptomyces glaucus]|uniref:Uncharacterized protein n=1 Tax=Streptomyces glaucus TaxID=284029 RepID=A0ABP5WCC5_9ACTN
MPGQGFHRFTVVPEPLRGTPGTGARSAPATVGIRELRLAPGLPDPLPPRD